MAEPKLGLTLYCFTTEYARGVLDIEGIIRTAAGMGYTGYEMVATQMCPDYPYVTDRFAGWLHEVNDRYGMEMITYSANMDRGMIAGRNLTEDEMLARAIQDVKSAHALGCTVMREQYLCGPNVLRRLAPYAEAYNVKVGIEIHNPEYPTSPYMLEYLDMIEKTGSDYIGFIPDFGCFAVRPNKPHWDTALKNGGREEILNLAAQMRCDGVPEAEARQALLEKGANGAELTAFQGMYGFVTFYKEPDLEGLKMILPHCMEFHGKFHYVHSDLHEHSIPYEQILPIIKNSDWNGYIMSEFEDSEAIDGITAGQMDRFIRMEKKILASC